MADLEIRTMGGYDWLAVAELIQLSTNYWYESNGKSPIFPNGPESTQIFCQVYEALDPGCTLIAVDPETDRLLGSCFYHPRETHVSLGIMNVHPSYFGRGVARRLLQHIIDFAQGEGKPVRLVSSAMNLDSYSLYTRAGFVPRAAFQDMFLQVPEEGLNLEVPEVERVREATPDDVSALADLEMALAHIRREKDYRYFFENELGVWHTSVHENATGEIDGFLNSIACSGINMIGPGVASSEEVAAALLYAELNHNRGRCPLFLLPVTSKGLVSTAYRWGAKNCEFHFCQVLGEFHPFEGIVFPSFLPESA